MGLLDWLHMTHASVYNSHPKNHSKGGRQCRICSNGHGLIRKYKMNICRQCFREYAKDIGFIKVCCLLLPRSSLGFSDLFYFSVPLIVIPETFKNLCKVRIHQNKIAI